jgi:hypothetical protein
MGRKTVKRPKKTVIISKGKNKGDKVVMKKAPGGKWYPSKVLKDKGKNSTLKNNSGIKFK